MDSGLQSDILCTHVVNPPRSDSKNHWPARDWNCSRDQTTRQRNTKKKPEDSGRNQIFIFILYNMLQNPQSPQAVDEDTGWLVTLWPAEFSDDGGDRRALQSEAGLQMDLSLFVLVPLVYSMAKSWETFINHPSQSVWTGRGGGTFRQRGHTLTLRGQTFPTRTLFSFGSILHLHQ